MQTKEDYKNEFWNQIISDISYNYYDDFGEDYEEQIDEWAETFANRRMKEQEENNKELTKYKRAFEILKEIFDIRFEKDAFGDCWIKIFPTTYDDRHILGEPTKEQYELLEEVMKGE